MTRIISLDTIKKLVQEIDVTGLMARGFDAYSRGEVVVPPVGELLFDNPPGDVHIKYGYIKSDDYYIIKIASGFYQNPQMGLPSSQGLNLLFSQKTGALKAILLDNGYLTDIRTAAAGALAARLLAPSRTTGIGIIGAGTQARLQLQLLEKVTKCRRAIVWVVNEKEGDVFKEHFKGSSWNIGITRDIAELCGQSNLIVTVTPSKVPLVHARDVRPGTHITAVGSDTQEKIELEPALLGKADLVAVDSLPQSQSRGEVFRAVRTGILQRDNVLELGDLAGERVKGRENDSQITVCDLTGVAVQDIMISKAVFEKEAGNEY